MLRAADSIVNLIVEKRRSVAAAVADEVTAWCLPGEFIKLCPPGRKVRIVALPWSRRVLEVTGASKRGTRGR